MYQRTYLDKCATIIKGSDVNTGLNPVADLLCGRNNSRFLIHFDETKIKGLVEDKVYPDISKLHHRLKITNAGSLDMSELHNIYSSQIDAEDKRRASSFDLIFFLIPELWDNGKGFDFTKNYFETSFGNKKPYDYNLYKLKEGVNWYQMRQGVTWKEDIDYQETTNQLFHFYIKSDKLTIGGTGATVTFTYYCEIENSKVNTKLEFEQYGEVSGVTIKIGEPIHFAKNGNICYTTQHKTKYGNIVKQTVTLPENPEDKEQTYQFRLSLAVGDKTFYSNPYFILQQPKNNKSYPQTKDGIYSTTALRKELEKYQKGEDSIVVGIQHFDIGNENIDLDITDTFNKFISGELVNYGIGIAYAPDYEEMDSVYENYIGLLTNKTNSFYEPYVETTYNEVIHDDRTNCILGKVNRLYMYANIGGDLRNLDQMPTCTVSSIQYDVHQAGKGIYYIDIALPVSGFTSPTMLYDIWDGLVYQGQNLPPVELDFTVQSPYSYFGLGTNLPEDNEFTPTVYGIQNNELIKRDNKDLRKINFLIKKKYAKNIGVNIDDIWMRMYVKDGTQQIDVIPYTEVNKAFNENYFLIDTSILIPETYYIDVKIKHGMEELTHQDVVHFKIVEDINNKFE